MHQNSVSHLPTSNLKLRISSMLMSSSSSSSLYLTLKNGSDIGGTMVMIVPVKYPCGGNAFLNVWPTSLFSKNCLYCFSSVVMDSPSMIAFDVRDSRTFCIHSKNLLPLPNVRRGLRQRLTRTALGLGRYDYNDRHCTALVYHLQYLQYRNPVFE